MAEDHPGLNPVAWLAAIVEHSDDAIVSKNLDGVVTSWNAGAERIFGYQAHEMVGQSILKLIPPDRRSEEDYILAIVRRGERIQHYDTVRRRKDGRLIDVSLTVSPIVAHGEIVGIAKIARDITERKQAQLAQTLLLRELNHRTKNLATAGAHRPHKPPAARPVGEPGSDGRVRMARRRYCQNH
jgi:PAS domain S-box-containing protein